LSHHLLAVVQLDHQRYQGLKVALDVAGEFDIPGKSLVVNSASPSLEAATIRQAVEGGYGLPVAGIVPYCEELSALCSSAIFILRYPDHPVARILRTIADVL
jgi:MinD-like ATPase involved in chromosome partitioning or flagellar assembly